jgi:uncharacterized protein (TIGR02231 family)
MGQTSSTYSLEAMNMMNIPSLDYEQDSIYLTDAKDQKDQHVVVRDHQLAVEFEINLPHDIASDGKNHLVNMKSYELPATYQYHAVPKLDVAAFLLAKITNWGQYNLLTGTASIFFEDTYIGKSVINPNITSDTLLLSFGRDDQISVKREKLKDNTATKSIGQNTKETVTHKITVRNNKGMPFNIEILDHIPITRNEDIEIKLLESEGADFTESYGKLLWRLNLEPGETKEVEFSYEIKYPKGKLLSGS